MKADHTAKTRILLVLKDLLESPFQYTKKDWIKRFDKSLSTIKRDLDELRNLGFAVDKDHLHRHGIVPNKISENLRKTLYLTETEFATLQGLLAASRLTFHHKEQLLHKLENLFDLTKVGGVVYNNAYMQKLNVLIRAVNDKQKVRLINYRSANRRDISNRTVEAFRILPKDDMIYAYEAASDMVKHFKISRFEGIEQLDDDWENEGKHYPATPDVFGYVAKTKVPLYVKLDIAGYNRLLDRFPNTRGHCQVCPTDPSVMELECEVNADFQGISQFLLGQHQNVVAVIEPPELIEQLNRQAKNIRF